jgi:hypothetical protein
MEDHKQEFINELLKTPAAKINRNGDEVCTCRCPICGDSSNPNHGHLHVSQKEDGVYLYSCKRCPAEGVVTPDLLHRMGIHNMVLDEYLKGINLLSGGGRRHAVAVGEDKKVRLEFPVTSSQDVQAKVEYIRGRTGLDFSKRATQEQYKCVLDLPSFYARNGIEPPELAARNPELWVRTAIGFVGHDNRSMSIRNIGGDSLRYVITHFDPKKRSPYVYMPQGSLNLLSERPTIVMTEGVFNLINIKNHFFTEDNFDTVFVAVANRTHYLRALMQTLTVSCFFGGTVLVYVDKEDDFKLDKYQEIFGAFLSSMDFKFVMSRTQKNFDDLSKSTNFEFSVYKL